MKWIVLNNVHKFLSFEIISKLSNNFLDFIFGSSIYVNILRRAWVEEAEGGGDQQKQPTNEETNKKEVWSDLCRLLNFSLYICKTWVIQNKFRIICLAYSRCFQKLSSPSFFLITHHFGSNTLIGFNLYWEVKWRFIKQIDFAATSFH